MEEPELNHSYGAAVQSNGPLSVQALSQKVACDYKNTHADVQAMEMIGLIVRDEENKLVVPWERITAAISLEEAA
ncbi:MAG: hypothetical protein HQL87_13225 [Magnetococcales bacterium]|nr:hypothetical protein [Magnetococcales bacterium]